MKNHKKTLAVAMHGMDDRTVKNMKMFLQGPCQGAASVVINHEDADVHIFDGDSSDSKKLLVQQLQNQFLKPVIVLSLYEAAAQEGVIWVKKPVNTEVMLSGLEQAAKLLVKHSKRAIKEAPSETKTESNTLPVTLDKDEKEEMELQNDWFDDWFQSQKMQEND
jgi:hypothetical protein